MTGIFTVGYATPGSEVQVASMMQHPGVLLIDIRLVPASRWCPAWRKPTLIETYGTRYLHLPGLGNVNYRDRAKGIQLLAPEISLQQLVNLLQAGHSLILLCACQNYDTCHRSVVCNLLLAHPGRRKVGPSCSEC